MTRQEQLDAINMKMARIHSEHYGTTYYFPIMIGDVLDYMENNGNFYFPKVWSEIRIEWTHKRDSLDKQSDDCIQYVYSLI